MIRLLALLSEMTTNPHIPCNPGELTAADQAHLKGYMPVEGGKWKDKTGKTVASSDMSGRELEDVDDGESMAPNRQRPTHTADADNSRKDPDIVSRYEKAYGVERPMQKQNDTVKYNSSDINGVIRNPMQHADDGYELLRMKAEKVYQTMKELPEGSKERKKAAEHYKYWHARMKQAAKMSPRASQHVDQAKMPHEKDEKK